MVNPLSLIGLCAIDSPLRRGFFSTYIGSMEMDIDTAKVRELLNQRDQIDNELALIFTGGKEKKPIKCGKCGEDGHTARTCSKE